MPTPPGEWDDRQLSSNDLKQRIIRMEENPFVVPDVAWDAQPVRYFKLNLQWCKILAGWLEWMEDVAGWQDAEDELHAGIQGFLEFERGINGGIFMTPDELKAAICDAIECSAVKISKRIVSGVTSGFEVDEDGDVVVGGDDDEDENLPDDDPETEINEQLSSKAGGAIAVWLGLQELLNNVYDWFNVGTTSLSQAQTRLKNLYVLNEAEADAFVAYWYANGEDQDIISLHPDLKSMLFCKGSNAQTLALYTYDEHDPDTEIPSRELLIPALTQEQFNLWFEAGSQVPSTEYVTYSCTKIPTETLTFDMSTANVVGKTTNGFWKPGHRMLIEMEGTYSDSDVPNVLGDGMYFHNTTTGVKTFSNLDFNSAGVSNPTEALVPFSPTHKYAFTLDKTRGSAANHVIIDRDNGTSMSIPNVSGILTVKITDLGEY